MPFPLNAIGATLAILSAFVTPFIVVRSVLPSASAASTVAVAGVLSIALNTAVPVCLHILSIPLQPVTLSLCHAALLLLAVAALRLRHARLLPEDISSVRGPALLCLAGALLLLPVTPLAGVDTYKWQDLATVVQVEGRIPWLVNPGGLFGFAPRGYPCAQPLTLASVQAMGNLGVEAGYFVVSLLSLFTAVFGAYRLGLAIATSTRSALWMAALYAFAPVAMRYHHWATGRGFFLAVLPLFVLAVLGRTRRHVVLAIATGLVLLTTHKTAVVAVPVLWLGILAMPALRRGWRVALAVAACAAATVVAGESVIPSPTGAFACFLMAVTRFGVLAPLMLLAVIAPEPKGCGSPDTTVPDTRTPTRLTSLLIVLLPSAFSLDMYGALMVLPLAAVAAVHGMDSWVPGGRTERATARAVAVLLAVGALAIVAVRDIRATPRRIRDAAVFLDAYDPQGPFRIVAPSGIQGRMQAYVRGCPRFNVWARQRGETRPAVPRPGAFDSRRGIARGAMSFLRNTLDSPELATDWYGQTVAVYYVLVDGDGEMSPGAVEIYNRKGVAIFKQSTPRQDRQAAP
jgi:hypothetical protein